MITIDRIYELALNGPLMCWNCFLKSVSAFLKFFNSSHAIENIPHVIAPPVDDVTCNIILKYVKASSKNVNAIRISP